jgi:exopolysaccharide biosynthesis protein
MGSLPGKERPGRGDRKGKNQAVRKQGNIVQEIATSLRLSLATRGFVLALLLITASLFAGQANRPPDNGPGITYMHDEVPEVPWSIHVVKVARYRTDFRLETALGQSNRLGMSLLTEQVKWLERDGARPMAAVNGDFYKSASKYPGDPEGLQISQGELVSGPSSTRSCFWLDAAGQPHHTNVQSAFTAKLADGTVIPFGLNEERAKDEAVLFTSANGTSTRTSGGVEIVLSRGTSAKWLPLQAGETYTATVQEVRPTGDSSITSITMILSAGPDIAARLSGVKVGDTITLSTATTPDVKGSPVAIGGGPALVRAGKTMNFGGLQPRHPRVAMGWNKTHFFLVEVDGRQKISAGMTFPELAAYMAKIGCDEAINLDGGGSATIWVYGNVMNSPSEGRPRPAANALVIMRKNQPD